MKKEIQIICTILIGISSVLYLKWAITPSTKNGFNRVFSEDSILINRVIPIKSRYGKILSVNNTNIVLLDGSYHSLIFLDSNANIIKKVIPQIYFPTANLNFINDAIIEPNKNIILSGNSRYIFICPDFSGNSLSKKEWLNFTYTHAVVINSSTIIFRKPDSSFKNPIFIKYNLYKHSVVDSNYLSHKFNDTGLSTDGLLLFNNIDKLFYVNHYNSEISQFDTTLNLIRKITSIDSTKKLPTVFYNPHNKTYKFSSPNIIVNNSAAANSKYLVINSLKRADNENFTHYRDNCIDIYFSKTGLYKSTFHIQNKYGSEIIDMKLYENNILLVLTNKSLLFLKI